MVGWKVRLVQGAVQRPGIGDQEAQIAGVEPGRERDGDADVARRLLPGTEGGFDENGIAGVDDVVETRRAASRLICTRRGTAWTWRSMARTVPWRAPLE